MSPRQELQSKKPNKANSKPETHEEHDLRFGSLGKSIIQSLPIGVIVIGPSLKIIEANAEAAKLIELGDYIDESLAKGTNNTGSAASNWTEQLKSVVSTGKSRRFDSISYTSSKKGTTKLLRIICTPRQPSETANNPASTVIIEDVTEKVNAQRQLDNLKKLANVGKLAPRVAHELNNTMDGILRYINLAMRTIERENLAKPKEYLDRCRQGLMRMVQIAGELLEFSRGTYASFESTRIEHIIEDALKTMDKRVEASNVQILRNYDAGVPQIRGDDLFQVFCNLVKNALDAMPDGGQLSISTRLSADNTAVAEFRDTGTGFEPEDAEAMFEPFFTTKDRGKGTGLGLSICKDIIERYHGRITAENAPQGGSTFTVYLPVENENP